MKLQKTIASLVLLSIILLNSGCGSKPKTLRVKAFKWSIQIPPSLEKASAEEVRRIQNQGQEAVEGTLGEKIEDQSKNLFYYKQGELNTLEANYQPYNTAVDGDYAEATQAINQLLYDTYKEQMPDVEIDKASSLATIDQLKFHHYEITMKYPNDVVLHQHMYNRLFGNKELNISISYIDQEIGQELLKTWKSSTFGKTK